MEAPKSPELVSLLSFCSPTPTHSCCYSLRGIGPPFFPLPMRWIPPRHGRKRRRSHIYSVGNRREGEALSCLLIATTRNTFLPKKEKKKNALRFRSTARDRRKIGSNFQGVIGKRSGAFIFLAPDGRSKMDARPCNYNSLFSFLGRWWLLCSIAHICLFAHLWNRGYCLDFVPLCLDLPRSDSNSISVSEAPAP